MPPKTKKSGQTRSKFKKTGNNSQSKLKYINSCVKAMVDDLPRQTFSHMVPVFFDMRETCSNLMSDTQTVDDCGTTTAPKSKKRKKNNAKESVPVNTNISSLSSSPQLILTPNLTSDQPVVLCQYLLSEIPRHPNIYLVCAFCNREIPSMQMDNYIEHPHSRRRFTPMCGQCKNTT